MDKEGVFTPEEIDYLTEIMNIASGNAATALSQILSAPVDVRVPRVRFLPPSGVASVIGGASVPVVCVKMELLGDARGEMLFLVLEEDKMTLARAAETAFLGSPRKGPPDRSIFEEIGNILAGVYLTALHDVCKLNVYHSVPSFAKDMLQAVLDETLAKIGREQEAFVVVENEFSVAIESEIVLSKKSLVRAFVLLIPSPDSVRTLLDSVRRALPPSA